MRQITAILLLGFLFVQPSLKAQVAINTDGTQPDPSAMLDVKSTSKGLLVPRVTTTQRTAFVAPADGLWVYDTNTKSFWFFQAGTGWQQVLSSSGGALTLPISLTYSSASTLFSLTNPGTGGAFSGVSTGGLGFYGATSAGSSAGLLSDNLAGGEAVVGRTASTAAVGAVVGRNDGPGFGVQGFIATDNSGNGIGVLGQVGLAGSTGIAGHFENLNSANASTTLEAVSNGAGNVATFTNSNTATTANIVYVTSIGPGVIADHSQGNAGNFFANNTNGVGAGVRGEVNSIFGNNGTAGVYGTASGTGGYGGYFEHSNAGGYGLALYSTSAGLGICTSIQSTNTANGQPALQVVHAGVGEGADISNSNASNTTNVFNVTSVGPGVIPDHSQGNAGNFFANNTYGVGAGVRGEVNSIFGNNGTAGVYGTASGTGGYGGYFEHSNSTGYGMSLYANTSGLGVCTHLETLNAGNTQSTLEVVQGGIGNGISVSSYNSSNTSNVLNVTTNSNGVIADHSQGNAGNFFVNNTYAVAAGVRGEVNSIFGNAGTAGIYGVASGTGGYAGYFDHTGTGGYGYGVYMGNEGMGNVLVVNQNGPSGDPALFENNGVSVARIDRNGRGYFDGGTQNSGADLAEAFDVEGSPADYEPGDVLLISIKSDRTLVKSNEAYSTLVAGVYATKPGVLLTEENIDKNLNDKVPMGVVGVIPTKVCNENGPIQRGDILVTASKPGYAMKADMDKLKPGQSIGKALEAFSGTTGKIKVLVNVK